MHFPYPPTFYKQHLAANILNRNKMHSTMYWEKKEGTLIAKKYCTLYCSPACYLSRCMKFSGMLEFLSTYQIRLPRKMALHGDSNFTPTFVG